MKVVVPGVFLVALIFILNPLRAAAFWPFSSSADAEGASAFDDSSLDLLEAATNVNPNPDQGSGELALADDSALLPYAGPNGTASADTTVTPASDQISIYTVRAGDTLSQIAALYGVSVNTIVWANNLGSDKAIHPGDTLVILPVSGIQHTVASGETLASIAKKYGANADDIASYNGLADGTTLIAGSVIIIPGGELSEPASAPTSSGGSSSSEVSSLPGDTTGNPYRGGSGPEIDGYYINPVPGAILTQGLHGENAVDLGIARGTPIHAAAAGEVIVARDGDEWNGGYGNYVVIAHANGTETLYAHMTTGSVAVKVGEAVAQGQVIGKVGMTGDATGPHLHFETRGARNPFVSSIDEGLCHLGQVCEPQ